MSDRNWRQENTAGSVAKRQRTKEMGCFVVGTLVHTKEGLKPIEQIKLGDLVLSKPESGEGELSYQPVTKTFRYENRELYFVSWQVMESGTNRPTQERGHIVVTGAHPLWIKTLVEYVLSDEGISEVMYEVNGWLSIEEIYLRRWKNYWEGCGGGVRPYIELVDGRIATLQFIEPVLQSNEPDIGVGFSDSEAWTEDCCGTKIVFAEDGPRISYGVGDFLPDVKCLGCVYEIDYDYTGYDTESAMSVVKRSHGFLPMRRTVFNFEVAHTHSYFVTESGLWVHDMGS